MEQLGENARSRPSSVVTYTTPFATAGDALIESPNTGDAHSGAQGVEQLVGYAYSFLSQEPTYTTPFATAGPENSCAPVAGDDQSAAQPLKLQLSGNAYRDRSDEPTYTTPLATAGAEPMPALAGAVLPSAEQLVRTARRSSSTATLTRADVHDAVRDGGG